jgi:hypothetical protein
VPHLRPLGHLSQHGLRAIQYSLARQDASVKFGGISLIWAAGILTRVFDNQGGEWIFEIFEMSRKSLDDLAVYDSMSA